MFKDLKLKSTYSSYENDIVREFYLPVLNETVHYDRATAYFSAKALAMYAKGLEKFKINGYKYRLIISNQISEEDYNLIKQGYDLREELTNKMIVALEEKLTEIEEMNLSNLAYLISIGVVDIKMAFIRRGIFHDKFGIMKDEENNIICFRGSNNETEAALIKNYESFDITCSWNSSEFDYTKINKSIENFNNLWENKLDKVIVRPMDKVIAEKIIKFNKGKIIKDELLLKNNCIILDYNEGLELILKLDSDIIFNNKVYKLDLRHNVDLELTTKNKIMFKKSCTYIKYKKIIERLEKDAEERNYELFVTNHLKNFIKEKELKIGERSELGLAIKLKENSVKEKFNEYRNIVNHEMERKLREKQMWDSFFMYCMKKSSNFSVPGSGKTSSVLGVYAYLNFKEKVERIVMIGPKNSFKSWCDEFEKCFGNKKNLNVFNIHDYNNIQDKRKKILYDMKGINLILVNYESLETVSKEISKLIGNKTLLVFDEIHKIKAINGKRAIIAKNISVNSSYTIAITGTPIPNSYLDIENLLNILYKDEYADFFNFNVKQLGRPTENDIEDINKKLQPFFCRTTKKELDVPDANRDEIIEVDTTKYENNILDILKLKYSKNKLALLIRILQLESNPKMLLKSIYENGDDFSEILDISGEIEDFEFKDYSEEIKKLVEKIELSSKMIKCIEKTQELVRMQKPTIIWCIFISSIEILIYELRKKGIKAECIYGNISDERRCEIIEDFKNNKIQVLITNPHTLAESVSLHSVCHDAIYFEYSYNLVHLLQSKDRIHRLGLRNDQYTQYYFFQTKFLIENQNFNLDGEIYSRLKEKENVMLNAIEKGILEQGYIAENEVEALFNLLGI